MKTQRQQQGSIVLLLMMMLALLALTPVVRGSGMKDPSMITKQKNIDSLAQAREALLNYLLIGDPANMDWPTMRDNATLYHARFPCPDNDGDGLAEANTATCGLLGKSAIGLFPWRDLGTPPLVDGSGNCLWYAVSGRHKLTNPTAGINADDFGSFSINAAQSNTFTVAASGVVAVIIAPGAALNGQIRTSAGGGVPCSVGVNAQTVANQYLESIADGGGQIIDHAYLASTQSLGAAFVVTGPGEAPFDSGLMNDQITWITAEEYALAATRHVAEMGKAAWPLALKAFYNANTDPNYYYKDQPLGTEVHIYPPPALVPGGACGLLYTTSGFFPRTCTLKDWWVDWQWWDDNKPSCGDKYGAWWVPGYFIEGYTDQYGNWISAHWDEIGIANEWARLECDRWVDINDWALVQVDLNLPNIATALATDNWHNQTFYTVGNTTILNGKLKILGVTLDGDLKSVPLILLRSRAMAGQQPCTGTSLALAAGCVEPPNRAAISQAYSNVTRQFSSPDPRNSNDLIRVMD